jgi:hypothetical protein
VLWFESALLQGCQAVNLVPTRQAVLQVLLWCFFEVAPPQQQEEAANRSGTSTNTSDSTSNTIGSSNGSTTTSSSSSSSSSGGGVAHGHEHMRQLLHAAHHGALWAPSEGETKLQETI